MIFRNFLKLKFLYKSHFKEKTDFEKFSNIHNKKATYFHALLKQSHS